MSSSKRNQPSGWNITDKFRKINKHKQVSTMRNKNRKNPASDLYFSPVGRTRPDPLIRLLLHPFLKTISFSCVVTDKRRVWNISIISRGKYQLCFGFSLFSWAQFTDSIRHKSKKNFKPNFMGSRIYLSICCVFWCEIVQSFSRPLFSCFVP